MFSLKGATNLNHINQLAKSYQMDFSLDLRPKSFNFTQSKNIINIINSAPVHSVFYLMFENEKPFMVKNIYQEIINQTEKDRHIFLEFTGQTSIEELDSFGIPYSWHYHSDERIGNLENAKYLKKLIFNHNHLTEYYEKGELFGFLNLFSDLDEKIEFELLINWDTNFIYSLFDLIKISTISIEINNLVELSYQNVDINQVDLFFKTLEKDLNIKG